MYFFYIDESGSRDPETSGTKTGGAAFEKDPLYVLTAVSLYEWNWRPFDRAIAARKLELMDQIRRKHHLKLELADCEVKSTWLRIPKLRQSRSLFLHELTDAERTSLQELYYAQLKERKMRVFSVVIDKSELHDYMDHDKMHKKAYELLLERIQHFLEEYHPKHQGVIVVDDTDRNINRSLSMKHAFLQREGNKHVRFRNIVESPFFTDSKLSNGVQLADLCGYNVYRAFTRKDFTYSFFEKMLPYFYASNRTSPDRLDGLKVFPETSKLVSFAQEGFLACKTRQPSLLAGL